jgi:hypothetical protein
MTCCAGDDRPRTPILQFKGVAWGVLGVSGIA